MQAQTLGVDEHTERNIRQCVVLWRACGDSDHDILGELIMRGYTEEEASKLMADEWQAPKAKESAVVPLYVLNQLVGIVAGLREQVSLHREETRRLVSEVRDLRELICTQRNGKQPN